MSLHCLLLAASHRPASLNRKLVCVAATMLEQEGLEADAPEYATFDLPLFNDDARERGAIPEALTDIKERFEAADALVIAAPEYNWSYPANLKNLLDWVSHLSPCPLAAKPALLMSASPSRRGGVMGVTHLKTVLESLGMHVYPSSFLLAEAHGAFREDGTLADAPQAARLAEVVAGFSSFVKTLHRM